MYSVVETADFIVSSSKHWKPEERLEFFTYLSQNPYIGEVIPHGGGLRKIRWSKSNTGKRGGVRVIYYNLLDDGKIFVLDMYAKTEKEDLNFKELKQLKGEKND